MKQQLDLRKKATAYLRVSTESQGESGVGIEIQKVAINAYARAAGFEIDAWVVEVGTGTGRGFDRRPQFAECVRRAREEGTPIIVKDVSRITRDIRTMKELQAQGVNILVADHGGKLSQIAEMVYTAVAEAEAKAISSRTLEGQARARASGKAIGNPEALARSRPAGLARRRSLRDNFLAELKSRLKTMDLLDAVGRPTKPLREIARHLNDQRIFTRHQKAWSAVTISKALQGMGCDLSGVTRSRKTKGASSYGEVAGSW